MFLKELSLTNYKNFESLKFSFDTKIICFVGLNGVGKTNILDSIYHLSYTKSYFNPIPSQNIKHGETFFFISGNYMIDDKEENILISLKKGEKKIIKYKEITNSTKNLVIILGKFRLYLFLLMTEI